MHTTPLFLFGAAAVLVMAVAPASVVLAQGGPLALGAQPASITLPLPADALARINGRRIKLTLGALSAQASPAVLYRVSVESPAHSLGYINFYNVVTGGPASFSFDVDPSLIRESVVKGQVTVILTPQGAVQNDAHATVGKVSFLTY
jgi:hypothetical protein